MRRKTALLPLSSKQRRLPKGQAMMIVLLVMVVILTVGLSMASRSVTDVRISQETEESTRAFSAAEAGIEDALEKVDLEALVGVDHDVTVDPEITASYRVTGTKTFSTRIEQGETAEVNLDGFAGTGVDIEWENAGLELVLIYHDGVDYQVARWVVRPDGYDCGSNIPIVGMPYTRSFIGYNDPKALRVRALCDPADEVTITPIGATELPVQAHTVRSQARGPTGKTRVLEVTKSIPVLPPIFDYTLFSGSEIE